MNRMQHQPDITHLSSFGEKMHSFAVLVYQDLPYLSECIESLLSQSVKSEIYISTSTPSDYIFGISKKYDIPLYVNQTGSGVAADWNFAIGKCRTPWLTLAHQDDIYSHEYTEEMIKSVSRYPDFLIGFSDYAELYEGKIRKISLKFLVKGFLLWFHFGFGNSLRSGFLKKSLFAFGSPIPCSSVIYNKKNLGDFKFSPEFKLNLGWDAWLRIADRPGKLVYVRKRLLYYRIHNETITARGLAGTLRREEDIQIFKRLYGLIFLSKLYLFSTG